MSKILLVDPSLLDRKRMRSVLEAAGHSVMETVSIAEALSALRKLHADELDLVVTELNFVGDSGVELIRWLKQQELWSELPIIVATVQPPRERVIELVSMGVAMVITKPFAPDVLLRRVTETLAERPAPTSESMDLSWSLADFVKRELKRSDRSGLPFSLVVCTLGVRERPLMPQWMGALVQLLRESDALTRMGPERIAILLPDTDAAGAQVVERRVWELTVAMLERTDEPAAGLAIGSATFPEDAGDAQALISVALQRSAHGKRDVC